MCAKNTSTAQDESPSYNTTPKTWLLFLALLLRVKSGWTKVGGAIVNLAKVGFTLTRKVSRQKGSLAFSNAVRPPFLF